MVLDRCLVCSSLALAILPGLMLCAMNRGPDPDGLGSVPWLRAVLPEEARRQQEALEQSRQETLRRVAARRAVAWDLIEERPPPLAAAVRMRALNRMDPTFDWELFHQRTEGASDEGAPLPRRHRAGRGRTAGRFRSEGERRPSLQGGTARAHRSGDTLSAGAPEPSRNYPAPNRTSSPAPLPVMSKLLRRMAAVAVAGVICLNAGVARPSDADKLVALWADLGAKDPVKAQRAIEALAAGPSDTVPFLRQRLKPVSGPCPRCLARLIVELDSDEFGVREKSSAELARVSEAVEPELRKVLTGRTSAEVRRRIETLLETNSTHRLFPTPERLREERAIEVLEQIGDGPARELLARLARGAAAPLTRDAKGALARLAASPAVKR
jgi:hypothetical protein